MVSGVNKQKETTRILLLICSILFGIGALFSIVPIMFSAFLFDAPGSENDPLVWTIFWSILSFPFMVILSVILSWVLYRKEKWTAAKVFAFLPLLNFLVLVAVFAAA